MTETERISDLERKAKNVESNLREEIRASGRRTRRFMTVAFTVFTIVVSLINAVIELLL